MIRRSAALVTALVLACACAAPSNDTPPAASSTAPAGSAADDGASAKTDGKAGEKADQKADERAAKQKELRQKQRELQHAAVEKQVQELDRESRTMSVRAALERAAVELEVARKQLAVFLEDEKPRELEERRISLDGSTYYAEHQKDELGELTAMYEADEFARTTKELVLKRGRREMELADRRLAVARREFAHFEQIELPRRERELRHKVADAELAHRKAEIEAEKARLELDLTAQKAAERTADLEQEIRELQQKLAAGAETP